MLLSIVTFFFTDRKVEAASLLDRALLVWSPTGDIPDYKCEYILIFVDVLW